MIDKFFDWLQAHYFVGFVVLCLIVAAVIATVWVMKLYNRFKHTEKECIKINTLESEISKSNSLSSGIEKNIDQKLLPKLDSISLSINSLVLYLSNKDKELNPSLFISKSPIQLTDIGLKILSLVGGKKYVDENLFYLISEMEKESFKSALDVQNQAKVLLYRETVSDSFTPIKNYIFQNPVFKNEDNGIDINLDLSTVVFVIGIYLRDKYFEKHPHLKEIEPTKY